MISFLGVRTDGRTDTVLESSHGNMSAHKKFQLKAQNLWLAVDPYMPPRRTGMHNKSPQSWGTHEKQRFSGIKKRSFFRVEKMCLTSIVLEFAMGKNRKN